MSRDIIQFCGTTLLRFSKNDPVLTRVSGGYPLPNCQRKVIDFAFGISVQDSRSSINGSRRKGSTIRGEVNFYTLLI